MDDLAYEANRCPLCGRFIVDTILRASPEGVNSKRTRFTYRLDLREWVCLRCNVELGPDPVRVNGLRGSRDPGLLEEYLSRFNVALVVQGV